MSTEDARFVEGLAAAYDGRFAAVDMVHWLDHPDEAAPSGAPSPVLELAALRSAVYERDAPSDAVARFEAAVEAWRADLAAIRAAIASQPAGPQSSSTRAASAPPAADDPGPDASAIGATSNLDERPRSAPHPDPGAAHADRPTLFRRLWPQFVAVATCVLIVFGAGLLLGSGSGGGTPATPTATRNPKGAAAGSSLRLSGGPLSMFDRPQTMQDRPEVPVGSQLEKQSFRLFEPLVDLGARAYAARNTDGDVCLAVITADSRVTASCTTLAAFAQNGIELDLTLTRGTTDVRSGPVEVLFSWQPADNTVGTFGVTFPVS